MSWGSLFGRTPAPTIEVPAISGPTPLQQQRLKQVESLRNFNQNVIEEEWDKEYSIEFTSAGQLNRLYIMLPPQFPNEKPIVRLTPGGHHPWLDERMYVTGCSSLNTFYIHSSLGKVIRQMIDDFKTTPPILANSTSTSYGESRFQNYNTVTPTTPTAILISTGSVEEEASTSKDPSTCTNLAELLQALKYQSFEDLEKLSKDNTKLLSYVMNMNEVKKVQEQRKTLIESNRELAGQNLSYKPKLEELAKIVESKAQKSESLESDLESKILQQNELFQIFDLNQMVTNLRIAISQSDEASEDIAEQFLAKKMPVDEFLQKFLEKRKISHLRKAKEERIRCLNPSY